MVNQKTNKCQKISNCSLLFICVFVYLIWMDVALYIKLQQLLPYSQRPKTRPKDGPFSPFEPITMKLLMNCPQEHYIHLPLGNFTKKEIVKKKKDEISKFTFQLCGLKMPCTFQITLRQTWSHFLAFFSDFVQQGCFCLWVTNGGYWVLCSISSVISWTLWMALWQENWQI